VLVDRFWCFMQDCFLQNLHQGIQIDATIQSSSVRREHLGHSRLGEK